MTYVGLESLLKEYEGRYRLVFKNYPLDSACNPGIRGAMHTMACFAAHFTRCAGEQGKFWEALDFVFTDPVLEDVEDTPARKSELLERGSKIVGLDQQAVEECVHSERHLQKIKSDIKEADQLGLESTPSFWVNGRKVPRPTRAVFSGIFEAILAETNSAAQPAR
jgi:protein-disulfide isomerase